MSSGRKRPWDLRNGAGASRARAARSLARLREVITFRRVVAEDGSSGGPEGSRSDLNLLGALERCGRVVVEAGGDTAAVVEAAMASVRALAAVFPAIEGQPSVAEISGFLQAVDVERLLHTAQHHRRRQAAPAVPLAADALLEQDTLTHHAEAIQRYIRLVERVTEALLPAFYTHPGDAFDLGAHYGAAARGKGRGRPVSFKARSPALLQDTQRTVRQLFHVDGSVNTSVCACVYAAGSTVASLVPAPAGVRVPFRPGRVPDSDLDDEAFGGLLQTLCYTAAALGDRARLPPGKQPYAVPPGAVAFVLFSPLTVHAGGPRPELSPTLAAGAAGPAGRAMLFCELQIDSFAADPSETQRSSAHVAEQALRRYLPNPAQWPPSLVHLFEVEFAGREDVCGGRRQARLREALADPARGGWLDLAIAVVRLDTHREQGRVMRLPDGAVRASYTHNFQIRKEDEQSALDADRALLGAADVHAMAGRLLERLRAVLPPLAAAAPAGRALLRGVASAAAAADAAAAAIDAERPPAAKRARR